MRRMHFWISAEDRQNVEFLRRKGSLRSAAETIRGCIRLAVQMYSEHKKDDEAHTGTHSE